MPSRLQKIGEVYLELQILNQAAEIWRLGRAMLLSHDERRSNSDRVMGHNWDRRVDELEALLEERLLAHQWGVARG